MIIRTEEQIIDGVIYEVKIHDNGFIEKHLKKGQEDVIPTPQLGEIEMQTNIEYLVALAEMEV